MVFQQGSRSCSYTRNERGWARNTQANAQRTGKCDEYLTMWSVSNVETDTYNHFVGNLGRIKSCFDTQYHPVKEFGYAEKQQKRGGYIQSSPAAYVQAWVTAPLKQSRPLQPQSRRITSGRDGGGSRLHPKWAHVLQISSPQKKKEWLLKRLKLAACSAAQHTVSKGESQMTLRMSPLLLQETLLWSFGMRENSSAYSSLGASRCWQSLCPAVAKSASWDETVSMAAFCHREGDWTRGRRGVCSMWFQGTICLRWEWEVVDLQGTWR